MLEVIFIFGCLFWMLEVIFLFGRLLWMVPLWTLIFGRVILDVLVQEHLRIAILTRIVFEYFAYFNHFLCEYIFEKFCKVFKTG